MKIFYMFLCSVLLANCGAKDKIIEDQTMKLLMQAVTTGQWRVTSFTKGGTDITTDFSAYKFQFKENNTVDALNNGVLEKSGTWNATGDVNAQTIVSNFPGATYPLGLINGSWNVVTTTWTSVLANQVVNGETLVMKLEK
jgi:hypothetical protein